MCSLSFFHYSEYLVTAIINPHSLSLDSFLLNHSVEYTLAAVSSWVEFIVEKLTVPGCRSNSLPHVHGFPSLVDNRYIVTFQGSIDPKYTRYQLHLELRKTCEKLLTAFSNKAGESEF